MRVVSTRVLPLPAPARISADACGSVTAASCSGFRFSRSLDAHARAIGETPMIPARRSARHPAIIARTPRHGRPPCPALPPDPPAANSATMRAFVHLIRSAAPYVHAFRGRTFVIAFGGEVVADDEFLGVIHDLNLLHSLGIRLVVVHGCRPQVEAILEAQGIPEPLRARRAGHRRRRDGLRARGCGPGARAHRGAALARPRQLADGRRAQPRVERQLPHRQADGRGRRRRHAADRRGPAHRLRGDPAAPGRRRHRADLADRLFAHRRDLQPDRRGSGNAGRGAAGGGQAHLPHGRRRRAQRPAPAADRPVDDRRRGAARQGRKARAGRHSCTCPPRSAPATTASSARTSSAGGSTARCCSSSSRATAWAR